MAVPRPGFCLGILRALPQQPQHLGCPELACVAVPCHQGLRH